MKIYVLRRDTICRPHGGGEENMAVSTNKKLIFEMAANLSHYEVNNRSSWQDNTYWVDIFDSKTGNILDSLEFDSNGRREGTFGKIVRERGSRDEKVVGSWV